LILVGDINTGIKKSFLSLFDSKILCNLEGPIVQDNENILPISKAGPVISSKFLPETSNELIFSLSNNHFMDYGNIGSTISINEIQKNGFQFVGYGDNFESARNPLIIHEQGFSYGIISCCEAQFGVSSLNYPGVNEIGPWIYKSICELRNLVDILIVSTHAAQELSPWPSPNLQALYQSFIDSGADVIHGHHSHVPQGWEQYKKGLILYGCGNFLVDPDNWQKIKNSLWSIGAIISPKEKGFDFKIITFEVKEKPDSILTVELENDQVEDHLEYFSLCNEPLKNPIYLKAVFQEVSIRSFNMFYVDYLDLQPTTKSQIYVYTKKKLFSFFKSLLSNKSGIDQKYQYLLIYHLFACLTHRDAIKEAIGILTGEIPDFRDDASKEIVDKLMPWSIGSA
jgi:hypothetical protein